MRLSLPEVDISPNHRRSSRVGANALRGDFVEYGGFFFVMISLTALAMSLDLYWAALRLALKSRDTRRP